MSSVKINMKLYTELSEYCKINSVSIVEYVNKAVQDSLTKDKYGDIPFGLIEHMDRQQKSVESPEMYSGVTVATIAIPVEIETHEEEKIEEPIKTENEEKKITKKVRVLK